MKTHLIPVLAVAMALPLTAQAQHRPVQKKTAEQQKTNEQPPKPSLDPASLARLDGIMDFCSKSDANAEADYKERTKLLTQDQPEKLIQNLRASKEYHDTLDELKNQLESVSPQAAVEGCRAFLAGK